MPVLLHPHPRFAELHDLMGEHSDWFEPWRGRLFRLQTVEYPTPQDVVSGEGARKHGGRGIRRVVPLFMEAQPKPR